MFIVQKSRAKASARQQIDIRGVQDDILLLPGRQYRAILEVTPVNFELKGEAEQDVLIDTFESFLDALPCPLQIVVRIRELDMDRYLDDIAARQAAEVEPVYQRQLEQYGSFVAQLVTHSNILSRRFYVVLPYAASDDDFALVKERLKLTMTMIQNGLARIGIQARQLNSLELLDLFQTFYSPVLAKQQPLSTQVVQFMNSASVRGQR